MCLYCDEELLNINGLLKNENTKQYKDRIKELLTKYYTWKEDSKEFEKEHPESYNRYSIRLVIDDDTSDDFDQTILNVDVWLPNDKVAKELTDIIGVQSVDTRICRITDKAPVSPSSTGFPMGNRRGYPWGHIR